jgi:hypothetical protein
MASLAWFGANAPDAALDEREIAARNRAYLYAYQGLASLVTVGALYFATLAPDLGLPMPQTRDHWWTFVWGLLALSIALPAAIHGWIAPDPLPETE